MKRMWLVMLIFGMAGTPVLRAADEKAENVQLEIYDVADLAKQPIDFPLPGTSAELPAFPGPFATQPSVPAFKTADLILLLHDRVFASAFADPSTSIAENNNYLVVMQTAPVQKEIRQYLSKLRETIKTQVVVKAMLVSAPEAPPAALLDAAAFAKFTSTLSADWVLGAPRLICYNGERAHVRSGRNFNYIRDYAVAGSLYRPVVALGFEGFSFEVQPTLNDRRSSADVDVHFTYTAHSGMAETRNISLAPPLAVQSGGKTADPPAPIILPIDVPALSTQHISTTLRVPLGQWMLAGVMNNPVSAAKDKRVLLFVSVESSQPAK